MLKRLRFFLFILGFFLPRQACADIEAPQTVIGTIKTGIEEARAVQEELNSLQEEIRSAAEGISGPIKDAVNTVNDVKNDVESNIEAAQEKMDAAKNITNDPEGSLSTMGSQMPGFAAKIDSNDSEELKKAVQKNYFMQRPKTSTTNTSSDEKASSSESTSETDTTDLVALHQAQEEKMNEIQRENFANLYSAAFTIRSNLAKEESEDKDKENTRDIIQSTTEKSKEMAERYNKIMLMQSMLFEFNTTQQARQFSYAEEDEDE